MGEYAGLEHRGPSKIIRCLSGEGGKSPCRKLRFEEGSEQAHALIEYEHKEHYLSKHGWIPDAGYHNMKNYVKYVMAQVEAPRKNDEPCDLHAQCESGYCRFIPMMEEHYCKDEIDFVETVTDGANNAYDATVDAANNIYDSTVDTATTGYETVVEVFTSLFG